jgi:integrase
VASSYIRKRQRKGRTVYLACFASNDANGQRKEHSEVFDTKREAQAALARWQTEFERGTLVEKSPQTVGEFLRYWLDVHARHKSPNTYAGYRRIVEDHIIPHLGRIHLQKLTPAQVQQFYADKLKAGCGTRTVQLCHMRLRQPLGMALRLGLVSRNVTEAVEAPHYQPKLKRIWTARQIGRFLEEARTSHYGPIWLLFAQTGMRRGEALGLRWSDIDWEGKCLVLSQAMVMVEGKRTFSETKDRELRTIPLTAELLCALREHRVRQNEQRLKLGDVWQDHDLVCPTEVGTPVNARNLYREYDALCQRAGVPDISIHGIRHTVATLTIASGQDLRTVADLLGHARTSTTSDIYAHALPHRKVELVHALAALVSPPLNPAQEAVPTEASG